MKRIAIPILALALAAPATAAAGYPPKPGKFRGTSSKGDPMGVRVTDDGRADDFFVAGVKMKCEDGYTFSTPTKRKRRIHVKLGYPIMPPNGRWQIDDEAFDPYGVFLEGFFAKNGNKTTGSFHIATEISKDHKHKGGNKPVKCDSGGLDFTMTRKQ